MSRFRANKSINLIAKELLVEVIQAEENLFSTAMLFAAFFAIFTIDDWSGIT